MPYPIYIANKAIATAAAAATARRVADDNATNTRNTAGGPLARVAAGGIAPLCSLAPRRWLTLRHILVERWRALTCCPSLSRRRYRNAVHGLQVRERRQHHRRVKLGSTPTLISLSNHPPFSAAERSTAERGRCHKGSAVDRRRPLRQVRR